MSTSPIERIARETFGFDTLRPGQREAIESVLEGRDTLVVMSTGSGKSAIYEIAGLIKPGVTVVISPLIALERDRVEAIEDFTEGDLEYLFLAPEQLGNEEILEQARAAGPSLIVVDEAHCISEWGHDFRPDYLRLGAFVAEMGHPTVLALTASASPRVREEICERLHLHDPLVVVRGFDRPNIWLGVERFHEEAPKRRALVEATRQADKPGLVCAATRRSAEDLADEIGATAYHAGMSATERDQIQNDFMDDQADVIVATTAFGMRIDKPNIRFVHHFGISESVDAYYQEIGRAGRDGRPARAVLFYRPEDLGATTVTRLEEAGALEPVEMMRAYAEHPGCRRQFILSYFGEEFEGPCGNCDNCDAVYGEASAADGPFAVGARVKHAEWGEGAVQRYDGDQMTVLFDAVGYRTLSVALVVEGGLLTLCG